LITDESDTLVVEILSPVCVCVCVCVCDQYCMHGQKRTVCVCVCVCARAHRDTHALILSCTSPTGACFSMIFILHIFISPYMYIKYKHTHTHTHKHTHMYMLIHIHTYIHTYKYTYQLHLAHWGLFF
jgi:hypothetical protein